MIELKDKTAKLDYVYERFEKAWDALKERREDDRKAVRYYVGDSLTQAQKEALKARKLPKVEVNICKPKVDLLTGAEREMRTGSRVYPIEGGDVDVAKAMNYVLEYVKNGNRFDDRSSRVFKDGAIIGEGWYSVEPRVADDFTVDVSIRRELPGAIIVDPESVEIDPNDDAEWMIRQRWMSPGKVRSLYKLKDTDGLMFDTQERGIEALGKKEVGDFYNNVDERPKHLYVDAVANKVRVLEMWYKKWKDVAYFVGADGRIIESPLPIEQAQKVMERYAALPYEMIVRRVHKMWVLTVSGEEVLEHRESPYNHNRFPFVPFWAYIEDDGDVTKRFGVVKNLEDLQDEKNSRHIMVNHILKTAPIGGGFYKKNAVSSDDLENMGGVVKWVGVNRIDDIKERQFQYMPIMNQIAALEEGTEQDAKEVSGLNDPMLGIPTGSKESGLAAQVRIRQGMRTVQELFDNHDTAKMLVLQLAFRLVQQYFDTKKILRILGVMYNRGDIEKTLQVTEQMLNTKDLTKYDVKIDRGENSITQRGAAFMKTLELMQLVPEYRGVLLPYAVDLSDHPEKEAILKGVGLQQQILNTQKSLELASGQSQKGEASQPKGNTNIRQQVAE